MKKSPQLIYIILQLDDRRQYTFVQAARCGLPSRIHRLRRSLAAFARNNSFDGYKRQPHQSEAAYRNKMRKEYGVVGDCIHVGITIGRNGRSYTAYSGSIYKLALGEHILRIGLLSLACVVLTPASRPEQFFPISDDPNECFLVTQMLEDHKAYFEFPNAFQKHDWFAIIPADAFNAMLEWIFGTPSFLPESKPPDLLKRTMFERFKHACALPTLIRTEFTDLWSKMSPSFNWSGGESGSGQAIGDIKNRTLRYDNLEPISESTVLPPELQPQDEFCTPSKGKYVVLVRSTPKPLEKTAPNELMLLPRLRKGAPPQELTVPPPRSKEAKCAVVTSTVLFLGVFVVGWVFLSTSDPSYVDQICADPKAITLYAQLDLEIAQEVWTYRHSGSKDLVLGTPDTLENVFIPEP